MQLTIEVNFISLKPGSDETRIMYTRSDNVEIMFGDDNDDIIEQLFDHYYKNMKKTYRTKRKDQILNLMVLISYIMILAKQA